MTEVYENFISKMFADMKIETAKELSLLYLGLRLGKDLEYCVTGYTGSGGKKSTIELGFFDSDSIKIHEDGYFETISYDEVADYKIAGVFLRAMVEAHQDFKNLQVSKLEAG